MSKLAILKTLHYGDIFDYPLKVEEIQKYSVERLTVDEIKRVLSPMASVFYCLPGREEIIEWRKRREVWSRPKLEKAKQVASFLKFIPWIKLIGVTGALAMGNSDKGDDIDLMIITTPQRLWLTRGLVVTFLLLTRQYRRPGKVEDKICPNLMLSEDALEFPDRDLFTAHEIVQMKPIFERDKTYQKFIDANCWVWGFLPNWGPTSEFVNRESLAVNRIDNDLRFTIRGLRFLENLAYKLQLKFMESKKTVEITTPSIIRFHPQDTRRRVLDEYQKRVYDLPK